jgi:cytochrome c biogenesis protein CcdA
VSLGDLFNAQAFGLGMLALFNPCGFALLPAYLGYFLGLDDGSEREPRLVALNRAQIVGLSMTLGFLAVFGVVGVALAGVFGTIASALPWVTLVIGIGLVGLGIAMVAGFQPLLSLPKLQRGTSSRSAGSMFLFGVSYALASLTCTITLFLGVIGTSASGRSFTERLGGFVSYSVGMGLMATAVTLAVAFGKKGVVNGFRRILPRINLVSALVLIVVGVYVAWYGYWSTDPIGIPAGPVETVESAQASVSGWINQRRAVLGWGFLALNVTLAAAGLAARRNGSDRTAEDTPAPTSS